MTGQPNTTSATSRDPAPGALELVRSFINTHDYEGGVERFGTPEALRDWLAERDLVDDGEPVTEADRRRAVEVREALRALCLANNGISLDPAVLDTLNSAASVGPLTARFDESGRGSLAPAGSGVHAALGSLLAIVVQSMTEGTWTRLKTCPADDCLWAFYDHSRNRSGHWCTMAVCGNRAKARTYRERRRGD